MWHITPESKIQLFNCKLLPTFSLGHSSLPDIRAIDAYIFWSLLFLPLSHARFPFSIKSTFLHRFSISFGGFVHYKIMWYSDLHLKHFRGIRSIRLFSEASTARAFYIFVIFILKHFSAEWFVPPQLVDFVWTACPLSLFLPKPELMSRFR